MKQLLYLIILLFFNNLASQVMDYEFDLLVKYNIKTSKSYRENLVYFNSKDQNYFLYIDGSSSKKVAALYDLKKMVNYRFNIKESSNNNEIFFEFEYKNSRKIRENLDLKYDFETKVVSEDSIHKDIKLSIHLNSKNENFDRVIVLKGKKAATNLFPLFRFSCLHPLEIFQDIDLNENMLFESAKEVTSSGVLIEYNLLVIKNVDFVLQIPDKEKK